MQNANALDNVRVAEVDGFEYGAGDGTRTHDSLLGKQVLYQLSYTRMLLLGLDYTPIKAGCRRIHVSVVVG